MKTAVVLVTLGTPQAPTRAAVRQFLREFLSDPRVVELPRWLWLPLLHLLILRLRPRRLAESYKKIWLAEGSPLRVHSGRLAQQLKQRLNRSRDDFEVFVAETYGSPSIAECLTRAAALGADTMRGGNILVLPLYPQYSGSTTGAVGDQVMGWMSAQRVLPSLQIVTDYHDHPAYIAALVSQVRHHWEMRGGRRGEKLLLSFHGLPQQMDLAGDPYRRQCLHTAELLCAALELRPEDFEICFQSRFGRAAWLQPYADKTLERLGSCGLGSVDVLCPGFSLDCLETLEEMAEENKSVFRRAGGGDYLLLPCLNDSSEHVDCLAAVIEDALGRSEH